MSGAQANQGRAAATSIFGRVRIAQDQGVRGEQGLHAGPLHADATAVDQSHIPVTVSVRGVQAARCCDQCWKLERSSPESLHCQNVAARSKKGTSINVTCSAWAVSATF